MIDKSSQATAETKNQTTFMTLSTMVDKSIQQSADIKEP
jgi:hypothetical protein